MSNASVIQPPDQDGLGVIVPLKGSYLFEPYGFGNVFGKLIIHGPHFFFISRTLFLFKPVS